MNFGEAIELMKEGKRVARKGWNGRALGKSMMIYLLNLPGLEPCIALELCGFVQPGWLASQPDMLAEDWEDAS